MRAIQRTQEYRKEVDTQLIDVRREVQADAEKNKAVSEEMGRTVIRAPTEGQVVINDLTCIGCATCANSCPYDNIQMVAIRDHAGTFIVDEKTQTQILKATKCDLCIDQLGGPACARACPHDALFRAEMREFDKLSRWLNR
jgi:Fe-S-cluster-containing dehydrogenase component